jgi:hypothetical protein
MSNRGVAGQQEVDLEPLEDPACEALLLSGDHDLRQLAEGRRGKDQIDLLGIPALDIFEERGLPHQQIADSPLVEQGKEMTHRLQDRAVARGRSPGIAEVEKKGVPNDLADVDWAPGFDRLHGCLVADSTRRQQWPAPASRFRRGS